MNYENINESSLIETKNKEIANKTLKIENLQKAIKNQQQRKTKKKDKSEQKQKKEIQVTMEQPIMNHHTIGSQTDMEQKEIAQMTEELQKQKEKTDIVVEIQNKLTEQKKTLKDTKNLMTNSVVQQMSVGKQASQNMSKSAILLRAI